MKRNYKTNNKFGSSYDPERILLYVDSAEIEHRVRALDILGQCLHQIYTSGFSADPAKDNSLKVSISFAILTRCDDISPEVRAQALTVFSLVSENMLKFLDEIKDQKVFRITETTTDISELELDVNGEHRFYWYCMTSFEERLRQLIAILHRRIDDDFVSVRKAAIIALEKLIVASSDFIEKNLKCLKSAFKDSDSFIRKQSIQSVSIILKTYQSNSKIQELWLQSVLPLVDDPEERVQSIALSLLEEFFLIGVFISAGTDENLSITLLKKLNSDDFLAYQKFLKKAFSEWKLKNKLKPECLNSFLKYIGTDCEECVWFYLSLFSKYCIIPPELTNLCVQHLLNSFRTKVYPAFIKHAMKTLLNICEVLPSQRLGNVLSVTSDGLATFSVPVEIIPLCVEMLLKLHKLHESMSEFKEFSTDIVETCENHLMGIQSQALFYQPLPEDEVLAKYFCILAEFSSLNSSHITPRVIGLLKCFAGCVDFPVALSSNVKAHALAALGKMCLQDEILARDLLDVFFGELLNSKCDATRSNSCVILIDMCKCYAAFADTCIPVVSLCFKDDLFLIRYEVIVLLLNLIQGGYIKWKPPLFFGFLSALIDKKGVIRELGHYAFSQLLPDCEKPMFLEYFFGSLFVLNNFSPPNNEIISMEVKKMKKFSIPGESKRKERMVLYNFLLKHMDGTKKVQANEFLCGILTNVAESVYPLNKLTECIIRDCFSIFTSDEIKTIDLDRIQNFDESLKDELSRFEMDARKTLLVEPVVKVVTSLARSVRNPDYDLIHDIILLLKDLLSDFTDVIDEILAEDKTLLNQLRLEIKRDAVKKSIMTKRKIDMLTGRSMEA